MGVRKRTHEPSKTLEQVDAITRTPVSREPRPVFNVATRNSLPPLVPASQRHWTSPRLDKDSALVVFWSQNSLLASARLRLLPFGSCLRHSMGRRGHDLRFWYKRTLNRDGHWSFRDLGNRRKRQSQTPIPRPLLNGPLCRLRGSKLLWSLIPRNSYAGSHLLPALHVGVADMGALPSGPRTEAADAGLCLWTFVSG